MAMGPLENFVFPGIYTRTNTEPAGTSTAGTPRFPALIGVASEEIRVDNFDLVRGSSALMDNIVLGEKVDLDGSSAEFTVENYPIVTGDGSGKVATLPSHVVVTVNGDQVPVNAVDGLNGTVRLVSVPEADDDVKVNYYFKRRDTLIKDEDVSAQADGSRKTFKVKSARIVKGDNSGKNASKLDIGNETSILYNPDSDATGDETVRTVEVIKVTVNGEEVEISDIDGAEGLVTLNSAPSSDASVLVSYFTSDHQDTYDILPASIVKRLVKVGLSQDTNDYSIGKDCVVSDGNKIHWGHSVQKESGTHTAGSDPLAENVVVSLTDSRVYGVEATAVSETVYALPSTPVDGSGAGDPTEDPGMVTVKVGADWSSAVDATVLSINGNQITLGSAPAEDETVYASYYENRLVDDEWTLTNKVAGESGTGKYTLVAKYSGTALNVVQAEGTEAGDASPDYEVGGEPCVNPRKAVVERVTLTFGGDDDFTVTSTGKTGSVTENNANVGYLGKTYTDPVTGFSVTLASDLNVTENETIVYEVGEPDNADSETYITASANNIHVIPGLQLTVSSTDGGSQSNVDDTVIIKTYNKSGNEPANGDVYYVSLDKEKTDFGVKYFNSMPDLLRYTGAMAHDNKLAIGARLAFLNGAQSVAIKQVKRVPGENDASTQDYIKAIDIFNEPLDNGLRPAMIQPVTTNPEVVSYLKTSNSIQSSIKFRNERTSVIGFAVGTSPEKAIRTCKALNSEKIIPVYPDGGIISLKDAYGNEVEYVVDGSLVAAAVAGRDVSPVSDVATPLTNASIVGFKRLFRRLDGPTAALVANAGCTVLEENLPEIRIMMYLTSDVSSPLSRDPRIVEVKHTVQQGLRKVFDKYIGSKNLVRIQPQVLDSAKGYLKDLKKKEIISEFKGLDLTQNENDPSTLDFAGLYRPVHGLNWILVTMNLRS